ncbi:TetR/AcrR family transcriptional regulator [Danxiaibacter flavus]|uniref:TetR/AcrR family transcriptional regulator n=1 Tax=Danxiaibacter flavus TaxID=3049108 RepID=A0ABV3ZJY6_9BACT|nr:TetR/AcrR family transcriptional regulator [Chitinophagaceae bacterium DXS]
MARIQIDKDSTRKDVILKAAAQLFTEKGYKAASMRDLAEKVGVEAASLYNHIKSKTELLHDICFNVATRYMEQMNAVEAATQPALEKVEVLLRFHIHEMLENHEEVTVSDREWKHLNEPYLSNYHNLRRTYRKRFAAIIQEGVDKNELQQIDAPTAVIIILHAVSGIDSWHRAKQKISAEDLENNMVTILLQGLNLKK